MMYRGQRVTDGEVELEQLLEQVDQAVFEAAQRVTAPYGGAGEFEGEWFDIPTLKDLEEAWRGLPPDVKQILLAMAKQFWDVHGYPLMQRLLGLAATFIIKQQLLPSDALLQAAQQLRIPPRPSPPSRDRPGSPGSITPTQAKEYHRRQLQRGYRPGQSPQRSKWQREAEALVDWINR